ncbi:hypothetical protein GALL_266520 [mine drainage metagenome]|uniref:Uncharacterized protein n=1 Tax=mine drainage metagenome TaxID=410659 RepID=A0A1J5RHG6_9ZZZZ
MPSLPPPVFLHSGFRTCSTWLWTRFRANSACLAYNEVFNDMLETIPLEGALIHTGSSWHSGHPPSDPYFLEFVPLVRPQGGIEGFTHDMPWERFFPEDGLDGSLSSGELRYLQSLIDLAHGQGKCPVLSATRSLGRLAAMKRHFGGTHLLLVRNPAHQWRSYIHQAEHGNPFFFLMVLTIFLQKRRDPFIARLFEIMADRTGNAVPTLLNLERHDNIFVVFLLTHVYLYMAMHDHADMVVDANALGADASLRRRTEETIAARTGLAVDLSDISLKVQSTQNTLKDPKGTWRLIDSLMEEAAQSPHVSPAGAAFGRRLAAAARQSLIA